MFFWKPTIRIHLEYVTYLRYSNLRLFTLFNTSKWFPIGASTSTSMRFSTFFNCICPHLKGLQLFTRGICQGSFLFNTEGRIIMWSNMFIFHLFPTMPFSQENFCLFSRVYNSCTYIINLWNKIILNKMKQMKSKCLQRLNHKDRKKRDASAFSTCALYSHVYLWLK